MGSERKEHVERQAFVAPQVQVGEVPELPVGLRQGEPPEELGRGGLPEK